MPFSAVNPSGVLGDSRTGETVQTEGMGDTVQRLWHGQLPALPGSPRTFVPQVTVDYLARFLATVPERDSTIGQDLCVLDPSTPNLPALIDSMARHMGVDPPKARVPVSVVRALPKALRGGVEREALRFLVEDRYDTTAADSHAAAAGLEPPDGAAAIERWLDYLVSTRFLSQPSAPRGRFVDAAGSRTFVHGDVNAAQALLLHGLPWNSDAYLGMAPHLPVEVARVDLPGLGRSSPTTAGMLQWLEALLDTRTEPITLVAHSLSTGPAVRFANRHPRKVARVGLIAPYFLQARPPRLRTLWPPLAAFVWSRATPATWAAQLGVDADLPAVDSAIADLRRRKVARRTARALASGVPAPSATRPTERNTISANRLWLSLFTTAR
jgi:pimeloyl-ACP methyl ester carboxylesterase